MTFLVRTDYHDGYSFEEALFNPNGLVYHVYIKDKSITVERYFHSTETNFDFKTKELADLWIKEDAKKLNHFIVNDQLHSML